MLSEGVSDTMKLTYQQEIAPLDLTLFVENLDVLDSIQFALDEDGTLPKRLTLTEDGVLSGTPEKAAEKVQTKLLLTAKNGATKGMELTFYIAKANPTVEVTVDGDTHTEGDLVSELKLILSGNSTKGLAEIISEIKALAAR